MGIKEEIEESEYGEEEYGEEEPEDDDVGEKKKKLNAKSNYLRNRGGQVLCVE